MSQLLKDNTDSENSKNSVTELVNSQKEQALDLEKYYPSASLAKSFGHALYGIKETWLCERNFKIHSAFAVAAVALGLLLNLDTYSWLALILVISFVLTIEILNTAIEHLVDLAANSLYHPLAKAAKDASAGAVLISSFAALICGLLIFCPRLLSLYEHLFKLVSH